MAAGKFHRNWTLITVFLAAAVVTSGLVIWLRYIPDRTIEISMPEIREFTGRVYVGGAVANPGFYPFNGDDSVETLVRAAGGAADGADRGELQIYVPRVKEGQEPQRIDINRAEVWLLESLPGIGKTLAGRIVDYRRQNGLFLSTVEIVKVAGIGDTTYAQIKHLITVSDR